MSQDDIFIILLRIFFAVGIVAAVAMLFMLGKAFYSYLKIYNSYQERLPARPKKRVIIIEFKPRIVDEIVEDK